VIARALSLNLAPNWTGWRPSAVVAAAEQARPNITVSVSGTSLPLAFVWQWVRQSLIGQDINLEGLATKSDSELTVNLWTRDYRHQDSQSTAIGPTIRTVNSVTRLLAANVKLFVLSNPYDVVQTFYAQQRYEAGIQQLIYAKNSPEIRLLRAQCLVGAHAYAEAEAEYKRVKGAKRRSQLRSQAICGWAEAVAATGECSRAIQMLEELTNDRLKVEAHIVLGRIYSSSGGLERAIYHWGIAGDILRKRLARLGGVRQSRDVKVLIRRLRERLDNLATRSDAAQMLWQLSEVHVNKATCEELRALNVTEQSRKDIGDALTILQLAALLDPGPNADLNIAVQQKRLEAFREAIQIYDQCISSCQTAMADDPDNFSVFVDMAWAQAGRAACLVKEEKKQTVSGPGEEVTGLLVLFCYPLNQAPLWLQKIRECLRFPSENKEHARLLGEASKIYLADVSNGRDDDQISEALTSLSQNLRLDPREGETAEAIFERLQTEVVGRIQKNVDAESIDAIFDLARLRDDIALALGRAGEAFVTIGNLGEQHLIAEAYYGLACLACLSDDSAQALTYLSVIIKDRGMTAYWGRALLDEDLAVLRQNPDFKALSPNGRESS